MKTEDDPLYAKTLGSGIDVLLALADGPIGLRELAARLELSRSKAYRLTHTLAHHGLVSREPGGPATSGTRTCRWTARSRR